MISMRYVIDANQLLLNWVDIENPTELLEQIRSRYGNLIELPRGRIDSELNLCYSQDEPLPPVASIVRGREKLIIYQYALLGYIDIAGNQFITRID